VLCTNILLCKHTVSVKGGDIFRNSRLIRTKKKDCGIMNVLAGVRVKLTLESVL